jgi:hypothetical protein
MEKDYLILKSASASRPSGEWNDDDFDVLANGEVVGRIFKVNAAPVGSPWMWTLAFGYYRDCARRRRCSARARMVQREQEHLAQADWHVSQMKTHIVRQRIRVKHARDTGQPSELADSMLHALEASLCAFERHRDLIVSQLKRRFSE